MLFGQGNCIGNKNSLCWFSNVLSGHSLHFHSVTNELVQFSNAWNANATAATAAAAGCQGCHNTDSKHSVISSYVFMALPKRVEKTNNCRLDLVLALQNLLWHIIEQLFQGLLRIFRCCSFVLLKMAQTETGSHTSERDL